MHNFIKYYTALLVVFEIMQVIIFIITIIIIINYICFSLDSSIFK
jgi:hypothetical protein